MKFFKIYKKKALTLIEVVISLAILFIIMIPISTMSIQSVKFNKDAEDKQKATVIAQKLMENVKSLPQYKNTTITDGVTLSESLQSYIISGNLEGFKVEGTIEPSEDYKSEIVDETSKVQVDSSIQLPKELFVNNIVVRVNESQKFATGDPKEFSIVKNDTETKLIFSGGSTTIPNTKSAIEIIAENNSSLNYKINVSNNTNETLALYCYKYIDSTAKFTVVNEKGKVVYYDNLAKQETPFVAATINRVYSIYIKVSKGNSYYEIKSDKAMVR